MVGRRYALPIERSNIRLTVRSVTELPLEPRRGILAVQDENGEAFDTQLGDRQDKRPAPVFRLPNLLNVAMGAAAQCL
jgi:hypothetical protein